MNMPICSSSNACSLSMGKLHSKTFQTIQKSIVIYYYHEYFDLNYPRIDERSLILTSIFSINDYQLVIDIIEVSII